MIIFHNVRYFIILFVFLFAGSASAQLQLTPIHDKCYDNTLEVGPGRMCKPLPSGDGYVLVGSSRLGITDGKAHHGVFSSSWNHDAYIAILDHDFNVVRSNIFGGSLSGDDDDYFTDVFPQADGGFVCFGHAESTDGDIGATYGFTGFVFKVDSNLNRVWSSPYNKSTTSMNESDCIASRYGGFYMIGSTPGASGDNNIDIDGGPMTFDWTLIKYDTAGHEVWAKVYGSTSNEGYRSQLAEDKAGNVYIIGYSYESDYDCVSQDTSWRMGLQTDEDIFVLKLDSAGSRLWTQSYGGTHSGSTFESPFCALYDSIHNEILIGGQSDSKDLTFSSAQYMAADAFFLRLDTAGIVQQVRMIGGNNLDQLKQISLGPLPNTYFLGLSTQSNNDGDMAGYLGGGSVDFFLCLIDQQGDFFMKYGMTNTFGARSSFSSFNILQAEVILGADFGPQAELFCDSIKHATNIYKPGIRRLRFDPLSVKNTNRDKVNISIYPNPVQDRFYIGTDINAHYTVTVYDLSGKRLLERSKEEALQGISIANLSAGTYVVHIAFSDSRTSVYKKLMLNP